MPRPAPFPRQTPSLRQIALIATASLLSAALLTSWTPAQPPPRPAVARQFHENATLPVEGHLRKRFLTAEELLDDGRWTEAITVLQEIAQSDHKGLVQVQQGTPGGFQSYLNVATRCNVLMSRITADGLKTYRQKVDAQAKRWFETWQRTRDETELMRIVRVAFLSSYGDEALLALGETAWDRGDFSAARLWWEQIVPLPSEAKPVDYPTVLRYPDSNIDQPTLIARIVLCSILDLELPRAEDELRRFSLRFPHAEGWIAGQQGVLADILKREIEQSRQWPDTSEAAGVTTFGLAPSRFKLMPDTIDVGTLRWSRPLTPNLLPHPVEGFPFQNAPFSYHPVVHEGIAFVNDSDSIRAWNLWTGEPAWQSEQVDPATVYPTNEEQQSAIPDKMCVGVPEYTMTIAEDRLYARLGSAVTCPSNLPQRDLESDLVCLDLNQQGKLLWKIPASQVLNDSSWRYEGTPVVQGGRAFVTMCRRRPQLALMIVCLDAADGRVLWQQPVGGFKTSVDDSQNRVSHLLLTLGGGRVFLNTDAGAVVALDASDGRFEWAVTYESRTDETPSSLSDPAQRGLLPALFYRGWLVVAPNDSDSAFCIEADSGRVRWQFPYISPTAQDIPEILKRELYATQRRENQWRQLLGVAPGGSAGRLIVSGKSLAAIDLDSGHRIWQTPRTAFGRGILAGDQIYLPARTSIEICSQQTGQLVRSVPLKTENTNQQGGNLTIASGMLLVAQPNRIAAYCEYSQLKERIERDLTSRPLDSRLLLQLADLELNEGAAESAESVLKRALSMLDHEHSDYTVARQTLAKIWRDAGKVAFEHSQFAAAREKWAQALSVTDEPKKRLDLIFSLAQAEPEAPEKAVAWLQSILESDQLSQFPFGATTAGQEACQKISSLIQTHGRDAYAQVATVAAQEFERIRSLPESDDLHRFLQRYPHATETSAARQLLISSHESEGKISEAFSDLYATRRNSVDARSFVNSTVRIIEFLEKNGFSSAANDFWASLSNLEPAQQIQIHGVEKTLGDAVKTWRDSMASKPQDASGFLEPTWNISLTGTEQVVFPENDAPSDQMLSVLVCIPDAILANTWTWRCLDWNNGQVHWETIASTPIQIARWTHVHLLIGTSQGWQARDIDGRVIWENGALQSSAAITPSIAIETSDAGLQTGWPISLNTESGISVLDPNDGRIISRIKTPGRLHPLLAIGDLKAMGVDGRAAMDVADRSTVDQLQRVYQPEQPLIAFLQTRKPNRIWVATTPGARMPWTLREVAQESTPWSQSPIGTSGQIVALTTENHLVAYESQPAGPKNTTDSHVDATLQSSMVDFLRQSRADRDTPRADDFPTDEVSLIPPRASIRAVATSRQRPSALWDIQNFGTGQAIPLAWTQSNQLLLLSDGWNLTSLNPNNGLKNWTLGIAGFPLESPAQQVCRLNATVYMVSEGWLSAIDVLSGRLRFQRYIGDAKSQWQTSGTWSEAKFGRTADASNLNNFNFQEKLLAIWSVPTLTKSGFPIWLADTETGEIRQRLIAKHKPRDIVLAKNRRGILLTDFTLSGLLNFPIE